MKIKKFSARRHSNYRMNERHWDKLMRQNSLRYQFNKRRNSKITYEQIIAMQENFKKYGVEKPRVLIEEIPANFNLLIPPEEMAPFDFLKAVRDGIENPETSGVYFMKMKGREIICERHKPWGCECGYEGL